MSPANTRAEIIPARDGQNGEEGSTLSFRSSGIKKP